jgi:hypothetical protein
MEREITRNDFGQIVSYEITSSNLEYGKVFLEPFVEKFDEDSYNEEYPLPQRDEFELPFNQVYVSFDITQLSFPAVTFQYVTSSMFTTQANSHPQWEMLGLKVENVDAGNSHVGACNRWDDEFTYYTFKRIDELTIGDYIFKDSNGITALVFMDDNKRMAFSAGGMKRSFKLEKGTGKILDVHICAGSGGPPPNAPLTWAMKGSTDGNNFRSWGSDRACSEWRDEEEFYTQKIIYELTAGDYIYRAITPNTTNTAASLPMPSGDVTTLILATGNDLWKAFSAGGYKYAFKLEKDTGRILSTYICPNSNRPPLPTSQTRNYTMIGKSTNFGANDECSDWTSVGGRDYYTEKPIWELGANDYVWKNQAKTIRLTGANSYPFEVVFQDNLVRRLIRFEAVSGRIISVQICRQTAGIPRRKGSLPIGKTNGDYTLWEMRGGDKNNKNGWNANTNTAACNRYSNVNTYYTLKQIETLNMGDYIYTKDDTQMAGGSPDLSYEYNSSDTFIPQNWDDEWFAFSAGGTKRAFKIERGTGKILDTHDC